MVKMLKKKTINNKLLLKLLIELYNHECVKIFFTTFVSVETLIGFEPIINPVQRKCLNHLATGSVKKLKPPNIGGFLCCTNIYLSLSY